MKKHLNTNASTYRIIIISTLVATSITLALYILAGFVSIPPESPLADPDFIIRPLNDPEAPYGVVITSEEMAMMPVNQLYDGDDWLSQILLNVVAYAVATVLIICFAKREHVVVNVLAWATASCVFIYDGALKVLVYMPFCYGNLRSGAQALIDGNYRLRVIIAYIKLWCDRRDVFAQDCVRMVFAVVFLFSVDTAILIELVRTVRKRIADAANEPKNNRQ